MRVDSANKASEPSGMMPGIFGEASSGALNPKLCYTVSELAKATGISKTTLFAEIREQRLQSAKVCGRRIVMADHAQAWLKSHFSDQPTK